MNHPWSLTKKLLFMRARIKRGLVSYSVDYQSRPATHSDRYSFLCFGFVIQALNQRKGSKVLDWNPPKGLSTQLSTFQIWNTKYRNKNISLFRHNKNVSCELCSCLLASSPLARWASSNQQHLFSYHQERSHCTTSDAVFRPLSALMHMFPPALRCKRKEQFVWTF